MSEALYDSEIAPKLAEVVALCERHGIPFVALCEYEPGQRGRTEFLPHESSAAMKLATYAARNDEGSARCTGCEKLKPDDGMRLCADCSKLADDVFEEIGFYPLADLEDDQIQHIRPTFGREHVTNQRADCWCSPRVEFVDGGALIIHEVEQ